MAQIKRRETADGTVRWRMQVFIGRDPKTGRRKFVSETFDRKKDAEARATKLENMKNDGHRITPSKETLSPFLERWLDEVKEGRVRGRTMSDYRGILGRYIMGREQTNGMGREQTNGDRVDPPKELPPVGFIPLRNLSRQTFEGLYAAMWKDLGLAPRTIQYLHSILRQALGHAVEEGSLAKNPTDGIKPYVWRAEEDDQVSDQDLPVWRAMSQDEADRFLEAAREDRYFALWIVLLMGGLRPGEAFGLQWDDVDMEEGRIHVRKALTRRGVEGPWKLVGPKTKQARRVVVLPTVAVQALKAWRLIQAKERLLLGAEYEDNGFVFANEFGNPLDGGNLYNRNYRRVMEAARLGTWEEPRPGRTKNRFRPAFRVYDLRHTCATLLLKRGVNAKIVQERLGHAKITLTLDTYSHVLPDMQECAADELEAMFGAG